jgi:acyl dehydratase
MMRNMGPTVAEQLKELGVKGILITAAEQGYITELACGMPECLCPEELGGRSYFQPALNPPLPWGPTHEHFPRPKRQGGRRDLDNSVLAHTLCNRVDYSKEIGRPHDKDLATVEAARQLAASGRLRASRTRTVTVQDIELFTEMTGDRNPLHYDEIAATRTQFGGIIVQGGITSGLLNAVVAEDLPGPGSVFLHVDWSFKAPVRPGDEITAEVEVLETHPDKPITKLRTTITNQNRVVVLDGSALVYTESL